MKKKLLSKILFKKKILSLKNIFYNRKKIVFKKNSYYWKKICDWKTNYILLLKKKLLLKNII